MNLFMDFFIYLEMVLNDFIYFINNIDYNDIR